MQEAFFNPKRTLTFYLLSILIICASTPTYSLSKDIKNHLSNQASLSKGKIPSDSVASSQLPSVPSNTSTNKTEKEKAPNRSTSISTVAESALTFISVFVFGCVIIISVYSWNKFSESSWGVPVKYQYSALGQYDNDRDEEMNEMDDRLDVLINDSSSSDDNEEPQAKNIVDINAPATLPMNNIAGTTTTTTTSDQLVRTKNGRLSNSSSLLDEDSDDEIVRKEMS